MSVILALISADPSPQVGHSGWLLNNTSITSC